MVQTSNGGNKHNMSNENEHPLLGKRCAVYIPGHTWFAILKEATAHDLTFETESGEQRIYPRGKYDVREAIDRER